MKKDKLVPIIEEIQKWCESNNTICFLGSTQDEPFMLYSYENESNKEWSKFLEIAKRLEVKIIVLEKEINLLKTMFEAVFEITMNGGDLDQRMKERYKTALSHDKEIAMITLSFHYNEICYKFSLTSEWYVDYKFASNVVEQTANEVENDISPSHLTSAFSVSENPSKRLTEQEIENYSRKVIEHEDFIKSKSQIQKQEIIRKILKEILGDKFNETPYFYYPILRRAEGIFEIEIKPKMELEIKQKVLELKAQGLKKIEIRSKLDISSGMVDRFYHMD